ncbi:MAG: hypothetical protein KJ060_19995 [Candidatus Hydrogenedentes bacterium]|nr:hypothetical protein [Candidatus Hydrogenedentota bacterium]
MLNATRPVQVLFIAAFLLIIFGEGIVQAVIELKGGERPQVIDLFTRAPSEANLRSFEDRLEKEAWSARALRPALQAARFTAYGDLGEKGLLGRERWLFYRPGVDFLMEPWPQGIADAPEGSDPMTAIVAFRDALAERGISLLVVPAPGKASVYPDRLSGRVARTDTDVHGHTRTLFERLDAAGVAHVDLFSAFDAARSIDGAPPLYLAQDTHWSPEGLRLAAALVAERVAGEGWVARGDTEYEERTVTVEREGDVVRMVNAPAVSAAFKPESVVCTQIMNPDTQTPYEDDPASPVLVLGDSFLRIYQHDEPGSAGFIAHLAKELKRPVTSIVNDGGASTLVRQELQRKPELLDGKKLVVWEFVERDLRFGMEGWQIVSLPPATKPATPPTPAETS